LVMTSFLAIGECMVEFAPTGDGHFSMAFAGDTFNTAWYLRRSLTAEHQVGYATAIGLDTTSDAMLEFMKQAGLDVSAVHRDADRGVGLYLIQLVDGERSFSYWRSQSAARGLASDPARLRSHLVGKDYLYFSGITLAILPEEDRAGFLETLLFARSSGSKIVFDTNLRPRLWSDNHAMCAWTSRAAEISDIVMPSFEDEALFFGDTTPMDTATRYGKRSEMVIVKNAAQPALAMVKGRQSLVPVVPVDRIVDTTAAGDSFNAGFLAAVITGQSIEAAVTAGAALAAKVVAGRGALVPA